MPALNASNLKVQVLMILVSELLKALDFYW